MNGSCAATAAQPRVSDLLALAVDPQANVHVSAVALDSREVREGALFLACRGVSGVHGLDYLEQALANGAAAVAFEPDGASLPASSAVPAICVPGLRSRLGQIADRFYAQPSAAIRVVGVTGTNGKSTVAWWLANAAEYLAMPTAFLGTLGAGRPPQLEAGALTTPDVLAVHQFLAAAREESADLDGVAMEVSSHALDQGRVDGVRFDGAIFTNLSRDHLDYHPDMQAYAAAKERLFVEHRPRLAVVNVDDEVGRRFAARADALAEVLWTVGTQAPPEESPPARHLQIAAVEQSSQSLRICLGGHLAGAELTLSAIGRFNAYNALQVLAVLLDRGVDFDAAAAALARCPPPPGRMQQVGGGAREPLVVVDYAHTPDSLRESLATLREATRGQLICVFGCGGDRDRGKRPLMAQAAEGGADRVFVTDDNPRTEDPAQIVDDILAGLQRPSEVIVAHDRRAAIRQAVAVAVAGDVVLVAGKGHEDYQIRGTKRSRFSDADEALAALGEGRR
ncbi:MAG: UDP-N-acetylmuramoyl-L-alanyl-D-glutamate--2,6-diaminopimelate ligase [Pseudomonadota bacterium]